jgi:triacylglycerol lipase
MSPVPVVLVHGIWDDAARLEPLRAGLAARGIAPIRIAELRPNDGRAPIATLAAALSRRLDEIARELDASKVDVVGFSMGALVSRYVIQRLGGKDRVRRFVSISGPHAGTHMARAMPLAGAHDMRPGSVLLEDLARDSDPWGEVEVHVLYTPFDLMIVPATSSRLLGAKSETAVRVPLHRWMISDARSLDVVAGLLR